MENQTPEATPAASAETGRMSDIRNDTDPCHVSSWSRVPKASLELVETLRDIATDLQGEGWEKSAGVVRHGANEIEKTRRLNYSRTEREYQAVVDLYENSARQRNSIKADRDVMREELLSLRNKVSDLTAELDRHLASLLRASVNP